jgi:hypothetical protein
MTKKNDGPKTRPHLARLLMAAIATAARVVAARDGSGTADHDTA